MEVYVLLGHANHEGFDIVKIFLDMDKAEEACTILRQAKRYDWCSVEVHSVV